MLSTVNVKRARLLGTRESVKEQNRSCNGFEDKGSSAQWSQCRRRVVHRPGGVAVK